MAIYHFSAQIISRAKGRSAVAAAAYRSGEKLVDQRTGLTYYYRSKSGIKEKAIFAPSNAPLWMHLDRQRLWNAVEASEKRKDAQLCREVNIALPRELNEREQRDLVTEYVQDQFVSKGMIADVAIHRDRKENPHVHIMLTMRKIDRSSETGFGKKERAWNERERIEEWRREWAAYANRHLELSGYTKRIDHRSLKDQGIDRLPELHEGPAVRAMTSKGIQTDRHQENEVRKEYNALSKAIEEMERQRIEIEKEQWDRDRWQERIKQKSKTREYELDMEI
jgi:ATP-dependent exoDNAse (exonuclease V) alpha subunit